eukprot:2092785-Amphidinium_carterae.2
MQRKTGCDHLDQYPRQEELHSQQQSPFLENSVVRKPTMTWIAVHAIGSLRGVFWAIVIKASRNCWYRQDTWGGVGNGAFKARTRIFKH